jgi:succinoglycan biosynthesis transport protein ExoP
MTTTAAQKSETHPMTLDDVYYALVRQKWRILACSLLGFGVAIAVYLFNKPAFQSDAMVFIRYVVENSAPGTPDGEGRSVSLDSHGDNIMATEVQILKSLDVAYQVVDAVGVDQILQDVKGPKTRDMAAFRVQQQLTVEPMAATSVIHLIYKSRDKDVVQARLAAIIEAYQKKHTLVHRGNGAVSDFLATQADLLRSRLANSEEALRKAKEAVGVTSVDLTEKSFSEQEEVVQQEIFNTQAEIADNSATLMAMNGGSVTDSSKDEAQGQEVIPPSDIDSYRNLRLRIDSLRKSQEELQAQFTEQNPRVKMVEAQLTEAQSQRAAMEKAFPSLAKVAPSATSAAATDIAAQAAHLAGLKSKVIVLQSELSQINAKHQTLESQVGSLAELQRQRDLDAANYQYYAQHAEGARIDEALGSGRALNIAVVQAPTPPGADWAKTYKIIGGIAVGGILLGLGWAFLIELYLDRSIRRPTDVERRLKVPLFLSTPNLGKNVSKRDDFDATLRDRLISYFESINLTHKPKLIAVTGVGQGAGVTTTATGLARSLSETGDGNVLLVDMTRGQGSALQFSHGRSQMDLDGLLEASAGAKVEENLYVVVEDNKGEKLSRALPARFHKLMPKLKESQFDYIIFDMPPVNQISITPRLAGFMDMVLFVMESEKVDRDVAKQALELLGKSRVRLGAILNKTKNYLPSRQQHDFLGAS